MSWPANAINTAWMWSVQPESRRFRMATRDVAQTQWTLLQKMLTANAGTEFGSRHRIRDIASYDDFARRVPVLTCDDLRPYIERICEGQKNVLTAEDVLLLEPTSGSSGGRKLIPYTHSLRRQMQRAVSAWIANLFASRPAVRRGKAYWSISPAIGHGEMTEGGIRVGFADDTEYLTGVQRAAVRRVLAVPPEVARTKPVSEFRYRTVLGLLSAGDLSLVSIWSPTFLLSLIEELAESTERLTQDLGKMNAQRAQTVSAILQTRQPLHKKLAELWPSLALISCWADGCAADYVDQLQQLFPAVEIQPKGLLATEAFVSFPLADRGGSALAIRSHFLEFVPQGTAVDGIVRAHELQVGHQYAPVVTTGGGLYRYRMNDMVEVVDLENDCPLIRFVGRDGSSFDLVGEKLDEALVSEAIQFACQTIPQSRSCALLVPQSSTPAKYTLFLQFDAVSAIDHSELSASLNGFLDRNPHYRLARELGQLAPTETVIVGEEFGSLWSVYEQAAVDSGIKRGDVKPTVMCTNQAVADRFRELLSARQAERKLQTQMAARRGDSGSSEIT